ADLGRGHPGGRGGVRHPRRRGLRREPVGGSGAGRPRPRLRARTGSGSGTGPVAPDGRQGACVGGSPARLGCRRARAGQRPRAASPGRGAQQRAGRPYRHPRPARRRALGGEARPHPEQGLAGGRRDRIGVHGDRRGDRRPSPCPGLRRRPRLTAAQQPLGVLHRDGCGVPAGAPRLRPLRGRRVQGLRGPAAGRGPGIPALRTDPRRRRPRPHPGCSADPLRGGGHPRDRAGARGAL
ncbi:MAG: hypothetical protein AVDCRST_MAG47-2245, partial [uncultured Nocardioidaceae bacterium]